MEKPMNRFIGCLLALAAVPFLHAQNLAGDWQGTVDYGPQSLRLVVRISQSDNGALEATAYSLDQGAQPAPVAAITRDGSTLRLTIPSISGSYQGRLNSKGDTITGTFTQGVTLPLVLTRATPATAWAIPESAPPARPMAADAAPAFEVSTVKPAAPDRGLSIHVNPSGLLTTTNSSVFELIKYAYDLNPKQITGGPGWVEDEKFDITAKPDTAGTPSAKQLKAMLRGLLAERFSLASHFEEKELQVYAIIQSTDGARIEEETSLPAGLPEFAGSGPRGLNVKNATIADFAGLLQALVLDRPVVDQTGFGSKRFNFVLRWTPAAMAADAAANGEGADAPPDLFTAAQQQLGLKFESAKAPAKVMVIDRVERPGEN
jgi:uncharacterized protein (TIGR03435 family)